MGAYSTENVHCVRILLHSLCMGSVSGFSLAKGDRMAIPATKADLYGRMRDEFNQRGIDASKCDFFIRATSDQKYNTSTGSLRTVTLGISVPTAQLPAALRAFLVEPGIVLPVGRVAPGTSTIEIRAEVPRIAILAGAGGAHADADMLLRSAQYTEPAQLFPFSTAAIIRDHSNLGEGGDPQWTIQQIATSLINNAAAGADGDDLRQRVKAALDGPIRALTDVQLQRIRHTELHPTVRDLAIDPALLESGQLYVLHFDNINIRRVFEDGGRTYLTDGTHHLELISLSAYRDGDMPMQQYLDSCAGGILLMDLPASVP
ncbi:hypothetical protein PLESTM_001754700 [Pleodorina starrii]|nr:hypothetical protein PLESTM_001070300 [Pleodorina starrii]GLC45596.1 hypothetical protein PLESTM_001754700 [Pleodorina starrii]